MKLLNKETDILPMRKQYELQDEILKDRLENLMPKLLKEQGVDMCSQGGRYVRLYRVCRSGSIGTNAHHLLQP